MRKRVLWVTLALAFVLLLVPGLAVFSTIRSVPQLFRQNAALKAQGYYMGEFEFKMVASQYLLTSGEYLEAYRTLQRIGAQMHSLQGLNKVPDKATADEQMDFLLNQQDPVTGAFMDHRYAAFSYFAPTCNVVETLTTLSRETGRPVRLKYPLHFLEQIKTPQQLRSYLDSLLYVGEMSAYFPGPGPYGPGVSEIAGFDVLEEAGVYQFSEPWKTGLRRWFYETQDPTTGFWGARIGSADHWRQKTDINATFHILKLVLTESGDNQSAQFPLRYAGVLARGILGTMDQAIPEGTAEQHDWGLKQYQGARMLTKYLWPHLSATEKDEVRRKFRAMLLQTYRLYRPDEGGFAYYTSDTHADVDGTGLATGVLKTLGLLPGTWERERLWGNIAEATLAPSLISVAHWEQAALPPVAAAQSFRVYQDQLPSAKAYDDAHLVQIIYPTGAQGMDIMDLRQGMARYLNSESTAFGNWESKLSLKEIPLGLEAAVRPIPVARGTLNLAEIARQHPESRRFYAVAYGITQLPLQVIEFVKADSPQDASLTAPP